VKTDGVVVNASPLIVLSRARLDHLLPQLFPDILVPDAVWEEVMAGGADDAAVRQLSGATWVRRMHVSATLPELAAWDLGAGESEVLTLARAFPGYRAVLDDAAARACARTPGIRILGTGGALVPNGEA